MELNNFSDRASEDYELVQTALKNSSQAAYSTLMERYRDSIFHTMLKMVRNNEDAEDLTIEAFGKAFQKLPTYSPSYAFSTWLFKIATNNCIDFIRKQRMKITSIDEPVKEDSDENFGRLLKANSLNPEESYMLEQRSRLLRNMMDKLKGGYRQMIEMRYFDEMSYQEISEKMNLPIGTVKAQLFTSVVKSLITGKNADITSKLSIGL
jgi:RNA polymerase sigma-70 factor (ECF subfamily)